MVFNPIFYDGIGGKGFEVLPFGFSKKSPKKIEEELKRNCKKGLGLTAMIMLYLIGSAIPGIGNLNVYDSLRNDMKKSLKSIYPVAFSKTIDAYHGPVDFYQFKRYLDKNIVKE